MEKIPFDDPAERLFIRIEEKHVCGSSVLPPAVKTPDWSANRSRLSEPEDVLDIEKYPTETRVGEFTVSDIPDRIEPDPPEQANQQQAAPWLFWVEHDPLPENISHSEVRMKKDGADYVREKKPGSSIYRKKIRNELARIVRVREVEGSPSQ